MTRAAAGILTLAALGLCTDAHAQDAVFEFLGQGFAHDVSADGSVITGNGRDPQYAPFIWNETFLDTVPLGCSPADVGLQGAGTPDISDDGQFIAATIACENPSGDPFVTLGRWDDWSWTQLVAPPLPPEAGLLDSSYGSAWGMSGDGHTVVGLFWRPGMAATGLAHACYWTDRDGVPEFVDLADSIGDGASRASAANFDGTVIGGWDEDDVNRARRACVWVNGVQTYLRDAPGGLTSEVTAVNSDGTVVGGLAFDGTGTQVATIWSFNGAGWDETIVGALPGTFPGFGLSSITGFSSDGSIAVGFNRPDFAPSYTGFVWTQGTGILPARDYFEDLGATIPTTFEISQVSAISADGTTYVGFGYEPAGAEPFVPYSFRVVLPGAPSCACDWNEDGSLNDQDFFDWTNDFFSASGPQGGADFNGDTFENDQDWFDFTNCFFTPAAGCE